MMKKLKFYRPDIDGLRALAIIPVILFHIGVQGFSGGFIGVDIFFVISGYLITSIILREIRQGTFSLVHFWERRVRRIIPVMFFILSVVAIAGYFIILFPVDFIDFGHSLLAQALFIANIFYMRKSSYFAEPAETMPLLHTWSLSVEEQFYIGFPILLLLLGYLFKKLYANMLVTVLFILAALSFMYNVYLIEFLPGGGFSIPGISYIWGGATNANAGFFFLPARAWELLIGAILATGIFSLHKKWPAEILSFAGVVAIFYAIVAFGDSTPFPGYAALIPTLGCACVILANTNVATATGKLLSFPLFVWIGLISYSLYLWHWPVIVFFKMLFEAEITSYLLPVLVLIFALSWFSYTFVETPFREKRLCSKTSHMFTFGFFAIVLLVSVGVGINYFKGFPQRASEASHAIAAAAVDLNPRDYECFRKNYREVFTEGEPCILGNQTDKSDIDFVLWGDSHSDAAMPIVDSMALESGQTGAFFGSGGCGPIIWKHEISKDKRCEQLKEQAVAYIQKHNVNKVLFIASWESDQRKLVAANEPGLIGNKTIIDENDEGLTETFLEAFSETIEKVSGEGVTVYVMKRVPTYPEYNVRNEFTKVARSDDSVQFVTQTLGEHYNNNAEENNAIDALALAGKIVTIDPASILCPNDICSIAVDGTIVYKDGNHINTTGAMLLRPVFEDFFAL